MHDKNFLYIALLGIGMYWSLKSSPRANLEDNHILAQVSFEKSTSELTTFHQKSADLSSPMLTETQTSLLRSRSKEISRVPSSTTTEISSKKSTNKNSAPKKDYIEVFAGLDTKPWLYRIKPNDTKNIGIVCSCGKDHSTPLFKRLVDLQEGEKILFEETNSTASMVSALYEGKGTIFFMRGNELRSNDSIMPSLDTPICKVNLSKQDLPTRYAVSIGVFRFGIVEPYRLSPKVAGIRVYRKYFGKIPKLFTAIDSIECYVGSKDEKDETYLQLNMRHLSATLATNALLFSD